MHGDTRDVREHEQPDWVALAAYLRWHLAALSLAGLRVDDDMHASPIPGGETNRSYLIRFGGAEFVLKCPADWQTDAHPDAVVHEHRWLTALHPLFPLAPRPFLLCDDRAIVGFPFHLMERRRGIVVHTDEPMPLAGHPDSRRSVGEAMVDALVALHDVDVDRDPLVSLGSPLGYLDREVQGWIARWHAYPAHAATTAMDAVVLWLAAHQPPDALSPTAVHGEFTLQNVVLNPLEPSRLLAVLDWETAALGDPLLDLGVALAEWTPLSGLGADHPLATVTGRPGYASRDELVRRYAARSGRDVSGLAYYEVLGCLRRAVLFEQRCGSSATPGQVSSGLDALARRALALTAEF